MLLFSVKGILSLTIWLISMIYVLWFTGKVFNQDYGKLRMKPHNRRVEIVFALLPVINVILMAIIFVWTGGNPYHKESLKYVIFKDFWSKFWNRFKSTPPTHKIVYTELHLFSPDMYNAIYNAKGYSPTQYKKKLWWYFPLTVTDKTIVDAFTEAGYTGKMEIKTTHKDH